MTQIHFIINYMEESRMENTITATLVSVIFIIIILEILRYFRKSKKLMIEFEDLERRVKFLENKINED